MTASTAPPAQNSISIYKREEKAVLNTLPKTMTKSSDQEKHNNRN